MLGAHPRRPEAADYLDAAAGGYLVQDSALSHSPESAPDPQQAAAAAAADAEQSAVHEGGSTSWGLGGGMALGSVWAGVSATVKAVSATMTATAQASDGQVCAPQWPLPCGCAQDNTARTNVRPHRALNPCFGSAKQFRFVPGNAVA